MLSIETLTKENWEEAVFQSDQLILVDFEMPWYRPDFLKEMAEVKFMEKWGGMVRMGLVDISKYPEIAIDSRVQEIPTLVLFDQGRPLRSFTGAARVRQMMERVFTLNGMKQLGILKD